MNAGGLETWGPSEVVERSEAELVRRLGHGAGTLRETARHLVFAGGRRMRVRLAAACGQALGTPIERVVGIAVAGELIHAASLLHDDVVDAASTRRGRASANARYGNHAAVLGGDWVLAAAMDAIAWDSRLLLGAVRTVGEMAEAAIDEVDSRGTLDGGLDRWRAIAVGKTGVLFGWIGAACALAAGRDDAEDGFRAFGHHLGVAFQLADDVSDLMGANGKDRFNDLACATPSWPIRVVAGTDDAFRRELEALWARDACDADCVADLGARLVAAGARDAGVRALSDELARGHAALGPAYAAFGDSLRELADVFVGPLAR
jgi:geranylgeranyl pyrophosphate synthase